MSQGYPTMERPADRANGIAIAALVLGIVGLLLIVVFGWVPICGVLPILPAILAIIFGFIGNMRAKQGAPHGGKAVGGLICGFLGVIVTIGIQVFWVGLAAFGLRQASEQAAPVFEPEVDEGTQSLEEGMKRFEIQIDEGIEEMESPPGGSIPGGTPPPGVGPGESPEAPGTP